MYCESGTNSSKFVLQIGISQKINGKSEDITEVDFRICFVVLSLVGFLRDTFIISEVAML